MKEPITILLLLATLGVFSQTVFKGNIVDKSSKEALPYVNIGVVGKNVGTASNGNGDFQIQLDEEYDKDTLRISMIGFKPLVFKVSDFKKKVLKNPKLKLEEEINTLNEVVVSSKRLKEKVLGNKTTSTVVTGGFTSNELGNEIGLRIKIKDAPTYVKDFNVSITKNDYDTLKFRLNFYDIKDGLPNEPLMKKNIIVTSTIKEGILTVDLSEYNIVVEDDFIVTLEWIEDLGDTSGLMFSAGFLGSSIIVRHTSQGDWSKITGISMGFNVTVKY